MSKQLKRLMAAADAAGYVFAAPDDYVTVARSDQLEAEFRNGHHLAARKATRAASNAIAKLAPAQSLTTTTATTASWLHTALATLRPKSLAA